jgi:hypothetical protein
VIALLATAELAIDGQSSLARRPPVARVTASDRALETSDEPIDDH